MSGLYPNVARLCLQPAKEAGAERRGKGGGNGGGSRGGGAAPKLLQRLLLLDGTEVALHPSSLVHRCGDLKQLAAVLPFKYLKLHSTNLFHIDDHLFIFKLMIQTGEGDTGGAQGRVPGLPQEGGEAPLDDIRTEYMYVMTFIVNIMYDL